MRVPSFDLSLGPEVRPRACEEHETVESDSWRDDWAEDLDQALRDHNGWGFIVQRPNMGIVLFDAWSIERITAGGGTAWVIVAREHR